MTGASPPPVKLRWIVSAFAIMVVLAAACAYGSLCLLFYQGQWQILFHPSATVSSTPANLADPFEEVRFDTTEAGTPQLSGWWIPASPGASQTILYLHGGSGSLGDALPMVGRLHALHAGIFAIDYRGFGHSAPLHPSETSMLADVDAALAYLADLRHTPPRNIVLYGEGVGATIAAEAAVRHPEIHALILQDLQPPAQVTLDADPRTAMIPVRLLLTSRLDPSPALTRPGPRRLFLASATAASRQTLADYHLAAPPKSLAEPGDLESIRTFLDR